MDPAFANAQAGDYHLALGSPLIDLGDPLEPPGGLDRDVDPRVLDGDGDGLAWRDVGWDEHNVTRLSPSGPALLGTIVTMTTEAPPGTQYCLGIAVEAVDFPVGGLGSFLINPFGMIVLGCAAVPGTDTLAISSSPAVIGFTFYLQSTAFTQGGVGSTSNRVTLVLQP